MKERPIIFSTEMVRAILEGRKTQTRRIVKYDVDTTTYDLFYWHPENHNDKTHSAIGIYGWRKTGLIYYGVCPYGKSGDRLWVRESFVYAGTLDPGYLIYKANYPDCVPKHLENIPSIDKIKWKASIFMPRNVARIILEITNIKVQRLQDITEEDAKAEGVFIHRVYPASRMEFANLWDSIHKKIYRWKDNPWVWVIEFKKL